MAHGLNLVLEDFNRLSWVVEVVGDAKMVAKFVTNYYRSQALFNSFLKQERGLEILRLRDTRFATNYILLKRLVQVKLPLQQMSSE